MNKMQTIGQHKIRRAHPAGLGVSRRRALRVYAQRGSFATESLEKAIQTINKLIFEQEQRRQRARANAQHRGGNRKAVEVQAVEVEGKPVTFRASARTEKLIKEPLEARQGGPNGPNDPNGSRSLSAYLSLPLDQYSLLDPGWISRTPGQPDLFVLRIPLFDLVGLELQPQISVRVTVDPRNSQVHFLADQFRVGDPRFDSDFKLHMRATLRNRPVPTLRPFRTMSKIWRGRRGRGGAQDEPGPGTPAEEYGSSDNSSSSGTAPYVPSGAPAGAATGAATGASAEPGTLPTAGARSSSTVVESSYGTYSSEEEDEEEEEYGKRTITVEADPRGSVVGAGGAPGVPGAGAPGSASARVTASHAAEGPVTCVQPGAVSGNQGLRREQQQWQQGAAGPLQRGGSTAPEEGRGQLPELPPHVTMVAREEGGREQRAGMPSSGNGVADGDVNGASNGQGFWTWRPWKRGRKGEGAQDARAGVPAGIETDAGAGSEPGGEASGYTEARTNGASPDSQEQQQQPSTAGRSGPTAPHSERRPASAAAAVLYRTGSLGRGGEAAVEGQGQGEQAGLGAAGPLGPGVVGAARCDHPPGEVLHAAQAAHAHGSQPQEQQQEPAAQNASGIVGHGPGSQSGARGEQQHPARASPPPGEEGVVGGLQGVEGGGELASGPGAAMDAGNVGLAAQAAPPAYEQPGAVLHRQPLQQQQQHDKQQHPPYAGTLPQQSPPQQPPSSVHTPQAAPPATLHTGPLAAAPELGAASSPPPPTADLVPQHPAGPSATGDPSGETTDDSGEPTSLLVGSVDVAVTVTVPPALAVVPRPLLGMTGSLIARYAISSLLPSFLDLLATDYGRWSSGQSVSARAAPAGDLAATAAANAASMGAGPGGAGLGGSGTAAATAAAAPSGAGQGAAPAAGDVAVGGVERVHEAVRHMGGAAGAATAGEPGASVLQGAAQEGCAGQGDGGSAAGDVANGPAAVRLGLGGGRAGPGPEDPGPLGVGR